MYNNVMVIDDSYFDRLIATKVLELAKFAENVIAFDSVANGVEYLNSKSALPEEQPEIIFLDIRMPETDGFGFLNKIEDTPELINPDCKIYMLSSSVNPEDISRANKSKYVFNFISKPLTIEKLIRLKDFQSAQKL
ncbi:response regulator [Flavobacterium sp. GT3R68]|uniref:response regulator n=1 Tax=Flavobacterium sp. GT3R68 TaxID=2594437 RepID=UPI000F883C91|nr:response regulator [Flavobacterium sp. GT3R68]RTY93391.1 response regulator [Flavobacterium sp. GSN2]TRW92435.1 response regulator [Flavobacterium sp. GT3R68]